MGDAAVAVTLQHRGSLGSCEAFVGSPRACARAGHGPMAAHHHASSPALSGAFPGARYRHPLQVRTQAPSACPPAKYRYCRKKKNTLLEGA